MRLLAAAIWSATFLSSSGLTCAGTLTRAPATERLLSPRFTWPLRLGSIRQVAENFGRALTVTLPLMSAEAFTPLILMLAICLAALGAATAFPPFVLGGGVLGAAGAPTPPADGIAHRAGGLGGERARDVQL